MKKIVITGGAGFIGSHIVEYFSKAYPASQILVFDKMSYAADIRNILHLMVDRRIQLLVGDVCDFDSCLRAVKGADLVIHAAAESHVDNSFGNSLQFTQTNVSGTHCLMEACRHDKVARIIHVSTDEVYGEVREGVVDENAALLPTNPYSASKAAAEMVINGYLRSYKLPILIVRANNIFGIRQFPEKIIPKFLLALMTGEKLTIHGNGQNRRHYLSAWDFAEALDLLARKGEIGGRYNIGTTEEYTNLDMTRKLTRLFGLNMADVVTFVEDRPFNDFRYAVDWSRIAQLGWKPKRLLAEELPLLAEWYVENIARYTDEAKLIRKPLSMKNANANMKAKAAA